MPIADRAEVVVIGGGVIGLSVLYHLAEAGCADAVLCERDLLGGGSTAAAAGGIRTQFSDELNVRISLASLRRFERFHETFEIDIGLRQHGYLFLLTAAELPRFRAAVALQRSLGVPSEVLTVEEALRLFPGINPEGLAGATFCPLDGLATPDAVVRGYADAARRLGARIVQNQPVHEILVADGAVTGVRTASGIIQAARAVLAAGVWSAALARTAGVELPVRGERRYVYFSEVRGPIRGDAPLTVDFSTGFYVHPEGPGLLLGGPWPSAEELAPVAMHRLPLVADLPVRSGWSGEYEMSPDHNAIVGATGDPAGLLYATGFSGHGFQQAPAIGDHLADLALGRAPALDLSPLSLDRFATNQLHPEGHVI